MKNIILFIILVNAAIFAQAPDTLWTKTYGGMGNDRGWSAQQTIDGGFIIAGQTSSVGSGHFDFWLLRTNANGDSLWSKTFGGPDMDIGRLVQQTSDSGFIVVGYTRSFGSGQEDIWLIKTDANGNSIWSKTFGSLDPDLGFSVQQTFDGGYIIGGQSYNFASYYDFRLIKTDSDGNISWTKNFGGTEDDYGFFVQQTSDSGYVMTGYTENFGVFLHDVWMIKTNSNGDTLWTSRFGGNDEDYAFSIQQTADLGYIMAGYTYSFGAGGWDAYLIKTDANGESLWSKTFGGVYGDYAESVQQTTDGGYIIIGYTANFGAGLFDLWLIKTDPDGNTLWTKTIGGSNQDYGQSVQQTIDGGYIITGYTESFGAGSEDLWLIRVAADLTGVDETSPAVSQGYRLNQNYPNPFNPKTSFSFSLPKSEKVQLKVFNLLGQEVAEVVNDFLSAGNHAVQWNPENLSTGTYLYLLQAGEFKAAKKLLIIR